MESQRDGWIDTGTDNSCGDAVETSVSCETSVMSLEQGTHYPLHFEENYSVTTVTPAKGICCGLDRNMIENVVASRVMNSRSDVSKAVGPVSRGEDDGPALKKLKLEDGECDDATQLSNRAGQSSLSLADDANFNKLSEASAEASAITVPIAAAHTTTSTRKRAPDSLVDHAIATHVSSASATSTSEGSSATSLEASHLPIITTAQSPPLDPTDSAPSTVSPNEAQQQVADSGPSTCDAPTTPLHPSASSPQAAAPPSPPPPLKSTTMSHLRKKYTAELEYMLREFRKLERQLLGAKGNGTGIEESSGSRERREKLHSFILHLEDTIRQIELGCRLEAEGKSTVMVGVTVGEVGGSNGGVDIPAPSEEEVKKQLADSAALTKLTKEKEEEENVQKLEEHILANLLPVKVRLKKQLAAQQGASRNPVGMPASRRGMLQPSVAAEKGKGTFAAAAEQRRKEAEAARTVVEPPYDATLADEGAFTSQTQFGKPLSGGGSSLTQKLHGATLGSKSRTHGYGVGTSLPSTQAEIPETSSPDGSAVVDEQKTRKILYAGMALGSEQLHSGVSAAAGVHKMIVETPGLLQPLSPPKVQVADSALSTHVSFPPKAMPPIAPQQLRIPDVTTSNKQAMPTQLPQVCQPKMAPTIKEASPRPGPVPTSVEVAPKTNKRRVDEFILSEEERLKLRKRRKRKKLRREARQRERERHMQMIRQQQAAQASQMPAKVPSAGTTKKTGKAAATGKGQGKKKGPHTVEYICALCSEAYGSTCDYNPWWALTSHDCPKCRKSQVPRIDITSPANAIEYHPALLAHAEDTGGSGGGGAVNNGATAHNAGMSVMHINPSHIATSASFPMPNPVPSRKYPVYPSDSDSASELSDISDGVLSDESLDSDDSDMDIMGALSPADQAEHEQFGVEYTGPKLSDDHSSRLLILMSHASTCPGRHKQGKHRDVCNSVKYLMLHVRDCPGTTSAHDICPFPWCRKVKHLLYHLVSCTRPKECPICSPRDPSFNLSKLVGLNEHRIKKMRERRAAAVAAAAGKPKPVPIPHKPCGLYTKPTKPISSPPIMIQKKCSAPLATYKLPVPPHSKTVHAAPQNPVATVDSEVLCQLKKPIVATAGISPTRPITAPMITQGATSGTAAITSAASNPSSPSPHSVATTTLQSCLSDASRASDKTNGSVASQIVQSEAVGDDGLYACTTGSAESSETPPSKPSDSNEEFALTSAVSASEVAGVVDAAMNSPTAKSDESSATHAWTDVNAGAITKQLSPVVKFCHGISENPLQLKAASADTISQDTITKQEVSNETDTPLDDLSPVRVDCDDLTLPTSFASEPSSPYAFKSEKDSSESLFMGQSPREQKISAIGNRIKMENDDLGDAPMNEVVIEATNGSVELASVDDDAHRMEREMMVSYKEGDGNANDTNCMALTEVIQESTQKSPLHQAQGTPDKASSCSEEVEKQPEPVRIGC